MENEEDEVVSAATISPSLGQKESSTRKNPWRVKRGVLPAYVVQHFWNSKDGFFLTSRCKTSTAAADDVSSGDDRNLEVKAEIPDSVDKPLLDPVLPSIVKLENPDSVGNDGDEAVDIDRRSRSSLKRKLIQCSPQLNPRRCEEIMETRDVTCVKKEPVDELENPHSVNFDEAIDIDRRIRSISKRKLIRCSPHQNPRRCEEIMEIGDVTVVKKEPVDELVRENDIIRENMIVANGGYSDSQSLEVEVVKKAKDLVWKACEIFKRDGSDGGVRIKNVKELGFLRNQTGLANDSSIEVKLEVTFIVPQSGLKPDSVFREEIINGENVRTIEVPDPEFFDFDKERSESSFAAGQIWAIYDDGDGLPRYYALINQVISVNPFEVDMTWLLPMRLTKTIKQWTNAGFSYSWGDFKLGEIVRSKHINVFSHRMRSDENPFWARRITLKPYKGEVWALYKNWLASSRGKGVKHAYIIVEIMSEFSEDKGVNVIPLQKVDGFTSLYRRSDKISIRRIRKQNLRCFSHQIPIYRLFCEEVPSAGCLELDTAATTFLGGNF